MSDSAGLADRIESWMRDHASADEGAVFDLYPDQQPLVIAALRQPPQPTGDVGELVKRLRDNNGDGMIGGGCQGCFSRVMDEAADFIESLNSRSMMPAWPHSLHALEHNAAADPKGLVMYFNTEREANDFSIWMARGPLTGAGEDNK